MNENNEGQVITFYSYKGGTGRTMSLANIACLLADRNKKVLAIDWDFEAPGLHQYLYPYIESSIKHEFDTKLGCLDLFSWLNNQISDYTDNYSKNREITFNKLSSIGFDNYLIDTKLPNLQFMKSGLYDQNYAKLVSQFDWEKFFTQTFGLFAGFVDFIKQRFDYILIDSRTGITDTSGICTMLLPDKLVVVFTPNQQSLLGAIDLVKKAVTYRKNSPDYRGLSVFPLPSRVDIGRPELAEHWRLVKVEHSAPLGIQLSSDNLGYQLLFEHTFKELYDLDVVNLNKYFDEVTLQYVPDYAYGEGVAVEIERTDSRILLSNSYKTFCDYLTELDYPWQLLSEIRCERQLQEFCQDVLNKIDKIGIDDAVSICYQLLTYKPSLNLLELWSNVFFNFIDKVSVNNLSVTYSIFKLFMTEVSIFDLNSSLAIQIIRQVGNKCMTFAFYDLANELFKLSQKLSENYFGHEHPTTLLITADLVKSLDGLRKYQEASSLYKNILEVSIQKLGTDHPVTKKLQNEPRPMYAFQHVRVIFLGYGESGKTSLIRVLNGEPVEENENMTSGIDIREWTVPNTEIRAHFWDFGGQVMAHAIHQFFLRERCLYVLVLNARSEINSTEQAEYWLEHVKTFGKNAPVMIVGNKADKAGLNLDMSYLKGKYPGIVDYFPLSCTQARTEHKDEFNRFLREFCRHLQAVGTHQMLFTPEQFGVFEELHAMASQSAFLKHGDFIDLCEKYHIATDVQQNWLLDLLDKLGMVIHFPQLPCLDEYVLNPRWLTHGVYTLMYERKAMLTEQDVIDILRNKPIYDESGKQLDYPPDKCRFIMDAMQEFKLCYPLPSNRKTLVIPELLATDQPQDIPFEKSGALVFEFAFRGFMSKNIMAELIVNRHEDIVEQIVWQRGALLSSKQFEAQALVQVDYHERILSIWVQGRDAKDYLSLLNDKVLQIVGRLNLDYEERVELPISAGNDLETGFNTAEKVNYRQLLNSVRNGIYTFPGKHNIYDLKKVLGIIMPDSQVKNLHIGNFAIDTIGDRKVTTINQRVSNSTVHDSIVAAETIENSFNQLHESKAEPEVKQLLERLLTEIKDLNAKVPASPVIDSLSEEATTLVSESSREAPRKRWYEAGLRGIEEAAKSLGAIAEPVLAIAKELSPLLLG